jgi:DNA-directed RNA polymerase specialized sigma24 family protein
MPLTRRRKDGRVYTRDPEVESQIIALSSLAPADLVSQARLLSDESDALRDEALVYFIRAFRHSGNSVAVNDLAEILITRWEWGIRSMARGLREMDVEDVYGTVIKGVFEDILDLETNRSDFYQCKFGLALKRRTISALRPYYAASKWEQENIVEPSLEQGKDLDIIERVADQSMPIETRVLLKEALAEIPQQYRMAYVLHHFSGWQIESNNPRESTLSKYFGKTPRTIRNWLSNAENYLDEWRGEER